MSRWKEWINPVLDDPELEEKYNAAYLAENVAVSKISLWVWQFTNLALLTMDYRIFGISPMFFLLLGLRVSTVAYYALVIHFLPKVRDVRRYQRMMFVSMLVGVGLFLFVNFNRPPTYLQHSVIDVVGLFSLYLLFPNRFLYRFLPALLLTGGSIALYLFVKTNVSSMIITVTLLSYALVNFLGILISAQLFSSRRKEFVSHIAEQTAQEKLTQLVMQDDLTGIANRRHFYKQAEIEFAHFKRSEHPLSVTMMDIDHFKKVNDKYGHAVGDAVLVQFTAYVSSMVRQEDLFGRLGGEEFALLLRNTETKAAIEIARRICEGVTHFVIPGGEAVDRYTVSIGVAGATEKDDSFDGLLLRADTALYKAKQIGRNRVVEEFET
ncbi:MAG TPA: GGDEF domain-containing protein [Negativicutes bacterium]|nr:GGDEF domain-containing protein [Negativicutes bacterium]